MNKIIIGFFAFSMMTGMVAVGAHASALNSVQVEVEMEMTRLKVPENCVKIWGTKNFTCPAWGDSSVCKWTDVSRGFFTCRGR